MRNSCIETAGASPIAPAASGPADLAKARTDLLRLFEVHGVRLSKNGQGWKGLCPFHEDVRPSLSVTPEKGLWNCFGCGKGGSAIDLVMLKDGLSLERAISKLLAETGDAPARPAAHAPHPVATEPDHHLLDRAATLYAASLEKALKARSYLASRGLLDPELLARFRVGYGDGTIKAAVPLENGLRSGLLNQRGVDFFYRTLTFPLLDEEGRVVSFYARHTQHVRHLYLRGPHRGLVNAAAMSASQTVVLTESVIDALSAIRLGVPDAVPLYGVNGFTADHRIAIERAGVREATLLLDNDEAGERAIVPLADELRPLGISVFRARLPEGVKDVNDMLVHGRAPDELAAVLAARVRLRGPVAVAISAPREEMPPAPPQAETPPKPQIEPISEPPSVMAPGLAAPEVTKAELAPVHAPAEAPPPAPVAITSKMLIPPVPLEPEPPPANVDSTPIPGPSSATPAPAGEGSSIVDPLRAAGLEAYKDGAARFEMDGLRYEVKGIRLRSDETTMRLVIIISGAAGSFRDRPDLYLHRSRRALAQEAGERLGVEPALVDAHLQRITDAIEEIRRREIERLEAGGQDERAPLSEEEKAEAMTLLLAKDLLDEVARDLDRLGYVGENENKKLAYVVASSRKTERPLSCIVRSSSGAGKSRLIEIVAELMPEEDVRLFSRITPQSLYYMGKDELAHRLLVIDERVGGEDADYSIRSLQTRRKLTLAAPIKDPSSGKIRTATFEVNGPVALMESTTAAVIHGENANRCFELFLDETEAQTRRVHEAQRRSYGADGRLSEIERARILRRHQNAQRLLRPLRVGIPFAERIRFPASWIRTRRDHERFLSLVAMIAFLRQHQRPLVKDEGGFDLVLASASDYAEAHALSRAAFHATLQDLSKAGQDLLHELRALLARWAQERMVPPGEITFSRRELRAALRWPDHRLRETLKELTELEEIEALAGRNGLKFFYRLAPARPSPSDVLHGLSTPEEVAAFAADAGASFGAVPNLP